MLTYEVDFDTRNLMLSASGAHKDGILIVERKSGPAAAGQIVAAVRALCRQEVAFKLTAKAAHRRQDFVAAGATVIN